MLEAALLYGLLRLVFGPGLQRLSYDWLDGVLLRCEGLGRTVVAAGLAVLLLLAGALYVAPSLRCMVDGALYAEMAADPFAFKPGNVCAFRRLTPFVSYYLGLRGEGIIVTNLMISALLLCLVYLFFRRRAPRPGDAFFASTILAFSMPTLGPLHNAGYPDPLTYVLVFSLWCVRAQPLAFYPLFALGVVNHEAVIFLVPWFVFLAWRESESAMKAAVPLILGYGAVFGVCYCYRSWVASHQRELFTASYYLAPLPHDFWYWVHDSFVYWGVGAFSVFKLLWVFPVLAVGSLWRQRQRSEAVSMVLIVACTFSQLLIVVDTTRMLTLGFMVMIVALTHLFESNPHDVRRWLGWVVLGNLVVPQLNAANNVVEVWPSLLTRTLAGYLQR